MLQQITAAASFLNSIFASFDGDLAFDIDGDRHIGGDRAFLQQHLGKLRVSPITDAGSCFVFRTRDNSAPEEVGSSDLQPTAQLRKGGELIDVYAFDAPQADTDELASLVEALGMSDATDIVPVPGTDGCELTDTGPLYSLGQLVDVYVKGNEVRRGGEDEGTPSAAPGAEGDGVSEANGVSGFRPAGAKYGAADVITAYDETLHSREIAITFGRHCKDINWKPLPMPVGGLIGLLSREHKQGKKDGTAIVLGEMVPGHRLNYKVIALHAVGIDIDTGTPTPEVDDKVKKLDCLAIRYTTHSHGKSISDFKKDRVVKFANGRPINNELMREYVLTVEKWERSIAEHVECLDDDHTDAGIVCRIRHPEMPKNRVIIPFKEPFVIKDVAPTQAEAMKKWGKVVEATACLLGLPFDASTTDPSRLFYLPRHPKGADWSISLFGGNDYFDWRTVELEDPMEKLNAALSKGKSKSVTDKGRELGRWSLKRAHGFQAADVVEAFAPDRIRNRTGRGYEIECPFDDGHHNPGDQGDRACLVRNATDGESPVFTISCLHESCGSYTCLDMLGKMLTDEWFPESVLEDEQFNAILEDDEKPKAARKIEKEDDARSDYESAITDLTPKFTQAELEAVVLKVINANLPSAQFVKAQDAIKKATKLPTIQTVRDTFYEVKRKQRKDPETDGPARAPKGQHIFRHNGKYNFDEACDAVIKVVLAENARLKLPVLCAMDGVMVRMETNANGDVEFVPLSYNDFWAYTLKFIVFVECSDKGDGLREKVPEDVARACHANCRDWLPEAPEVVDAQSFLRHDTLLYTSGYKYDPEEKLNHLVRLGSLPGAVHVPEKPTEADTKAAVDYLKTELLVDFPFLDTDTEENERREPAEANALAMILTPFMRRMIEGCTPLFFITKPDAGTGATALASVPPLIFDGKQPELTRYTSKDDELSKIIVAVVQQPRSHVIFDNVTELNNIELIRTLTAKHVSGRLLGANKIVSRPNNYNWLATGINPYIKAEMERRICWIRMNAEGRSSDDYPFRHPTVSGQALDQFVLSQRHIIIGHILTMIQYWINKGMPPFTTRRRASFEDWSAKVGGVLQVCGVEGFLDNKKFTGQDREKIAWTQIAVRWFKRYATGKDNSVTENQIYDLATNPPVAIIHGHNEESRRSNFMNALPTMTGKTFMFEAEPKVQKPFKVKCDTDGDGGVSYWFEPVERKEAKHGLD